MKCKQDIDVSDDNIFLQTLLEKHGIVAKQLAGWTGRATSTVYKYLSGELTIPSIVWRSIFAHTLDIAILKLFTGEIDCVFAPISKVTTPPNATTIKKILEMRQKQIDVEQYILQILQDGRIDASDAKVVAHYKLAFPDMIAVQAQLFQAITHEFGETIRKVKV